MLYVTPLNYFKRNNKDVGAEGSPDRQILLREIGVCFITLNRVENKDWTISGAQL